MSISETRESNESFILLHFVKFFQLQRDVVKYDSTSDSRLPEISAEVVVVKTRSKSLECSACNSYGCSKVKQNIEPQGSDTELKALDKNIEEGDNVVLECSALKTYADSVTWVVDQSVRDLVQEGTLQNLLLTKFQVPQF